MLRARRTRRLSALLFLYRHVLRDRLAVDGDSRAREAAAPRADGAVARRGAAPARGDGRSNLAARESAVRHRHAPAGMPALAREGHRLRAQRNHRARWQGRQGSAHGVAAQAGRSAAARSRTRAPAAPAGSGCRIRRGVAAARAGAQVSERAARVRLAIRVRGGEALARSAWRQDASPSFRRRGAVARDQARLPAGRPSSSRSARTRCAIRSPRT